MKKILLTISAFLISLSLFAQMTQIQITSVRRYPSYAEAAYKMRFTLPSQFGTGANPIDGLSAIVASYPGYGLETIPATGTVITYSDQQAIPVGTTLSQIKTFLQTQYTAIQSQITSFALSSYDSLSGLKYNGTTWGNYSTITDFPLATELNSGVTATGSAGASVTLTIPAVVGKFHLITHISITAYTTAARTGGTTPVIVTTTNLPGSPAFTFASAGAVGTTDPKVIEPDTPIRSSVANTATTIVCPATTSVIWRVQVFYNTTN